MLISAPTALVIPAAYVRHQPDEIRSAGIGTGIHWRPERSDRALFSMPGSPFSEADLARCLESLESLLDLREDWNGYGAAAPNRLALHHAAVWAVSLYKEVIARGGRFLAPNVTASSEGDVVLEWWKGQKKLTVYISPQSAEYVKSWGSDIESEMDEGRADIETQRRALWEWLAS